MLFPAFGSPHSPSPSLSKRENASLNSAICSSVSCSAILINRIKVFLFFLSVSCWVQSRLFAEVDLRGQTISDYNVNKLKLVKDKRKGKTERMIFSKIQNLNFEFRSFMDNTR